MLFKTIWNAWTNIYLGSVLARLRMKCLGSFLQGNGGSSSNILCRPRQSFLPRAYSKGLPTSTSPYPQRTPSSGDLSGLHRLTGVATSHPVPLPPPMSHTRRGPPPMYNPNPLRYLPLVSFLRTGAVRIPGCQLDSNPDSTVPLSVAVETVVFARAKQRRCRATAMSRHSHENQSPNPLRSPNGVPVAKRTAPAPPPEAYAASSRNYSLGCTLIPLVNRLQDIFAQVRRKDGRT